MYGSQTALCNKEISAKDISARSFALDCAIGLPVPCLVPHLQRSTGLVNARKRRMNFGPVGAAELAGLHCGGSSRRRADASLCFSRCPSWR